MEFVKHGIVNAGGDLKAAVADYESFGNVDDLMRWVPGLCRVPTLKIRDSQSGDALCRNDPHSSHSG